MTGARFTWPAAFVVALSGHLAVVGVGFLSLADAKRAAVEDFGVVNAIDFELAPMAMDGEGEANLESRAAPHVIETPSMEQQLSPAFPDDALVAASSPYATPPDLEAARQKTRDQTDNEPDDVRPTEVVEARKPEQQSQGAVAATAGGVDAGQSEVNVAAATGSSISDVEALESWQRALMAHLGSHKRYPAAARSAKQEGEPVISLRLSSTGRVLVAELARSSSHVALDREALELLQRAQPLPRAPPSLGAAGIHLIIPIRFVLK